MQSVTTSRTIPASAERVWEVLSDFQNAQANFLPAKSSERVGAVDRGLDASRRLAFKNGDVVVESVVKFDDSARSQKFEFVEHASLCAWGPAAAGHKCAPTARPWAPNQCYHSRDYQSYFTHISESTVYQLSAINAYTICASV